jgi:signal transduction histidine kinase
MTIPLEAADTSSLALVLERIELGVVGVRLEEQRILFWNPEARELLGEPVTAVAMAAIFGHKLALTRANGASLLIGDFVRVGERCVGFSVYDLPDGSKWIILRDVTEKLRLQRAAEGMTVANNLGYAFAGVAHELGNPINSVKMAATVLRDHMDDFSPEKTREYLTEILSETNRMQEILRLMQGFIGIASLEPVPTDLATECRKVVELVARDATQKGIAIVSAFAARASVVARVDPSAFRQVLLNLFSNAVDAVAGASLPQIVIDAWLGDDSAHVRVSDNGKGISRERQERLFFPFYSTRPGGMGFGLVIVKKLVSSMGGTIEVASVPGSGTSFELLLPFADGVRP